MLRTWPRVVLLASLEAVSAAVLLSAVAAVAAAEPLNVQKKASAADPASNPCTKLKLLRPGTVMVPGGGAGSEGYVHELLARKQAVVPCCQAPSLRRTARPARMQLPQDGWHSSAMHTARVLTRARVALLLSPSGGLLQLQAQSLHTEVCPAGRPLHEVSSGFLFRWQLKLLRGCAVGVRDPRARDRQRRRDCQHACSECSAPASARRRGPRYGGVRL